MEFPDQLHLPLEYRRAGFWKRLLAVLIDGALGLVGGLFVGLFLTSAGLYELSMMDVAQLSELQDMYASMGLERGLATDVLLMLNAFGIGVIVVTILLSLLEAVKGASVGKMTLGLEIGTIDGHKGSTGLWTKRWLIKNMSTLLSAVGTIHVLSFLGVIGQLMGFVVFIGCFFVLGQERLALHDRIAQTAVFPKEYLQ